MPEFIKLSLKKVKSPDGRCSPLMGSPAPRSFWAPTGAVWPSWLLGCRRAPFCANKQPSVQGQLLHSHPSAPFEAWGVSEHSIAVVGCEGKGFIALKGVCPSTFSCLLQTCDPRAWLSGQNGVLFNWNQGQFLLWRCPFQCRLEPGSFSGVNQWRFYKVMCYQSKSVWFTSPSICPSGQNQKHSKNTGFVLPQQQYPD